MSSYGHYGPEPDDVRWISCPACGCSNSVRAGFQEVCFTCSKRANELRWGELRFDLATKQGRENYQRCLKVVK